MTIMEVLEFAGGETLLGGELRPSIDLDGAHSQREAARSGWPRSWRRGGHGPAVELHHIRARDHVARGAAERVRCGGRTPIKHPRYFHRLDLARVIASLKV